MNFNFYALFLKNFKCSNLNKSIFLFFYISDLIIKVVYRILDQPVQPIHKVR